MPNGTVCLFLTHGLGEALSFGHQTLDAGDRGVCITDQQVAAGERIANVGNGEGLFPYHLHFDLSRTDILLTKPAHWPGSNRALVLAHYVDPKDWLQNHCQVGGTSPRPVRTIYVIAGLGLRVRCDHGISALQTGLLPYGSRVTVELETVDQDSYTWGHISGGTFHGDWLALGKANQNQIFVSSNPPST